MKKILALIALVFAVAFCSCTSTMNITTNDTRSAYTVEGASYTEYKYVKVQDGFTMSQVKKEVTSQIDSISYTCDIDNIIHANLNLADGNALTVSVSNDILRSPEFCIGKTISYFTTSYVEIPKYRYVKHITQVVNDTIQSIVSDTVDRIETDMKFKDQIRAAYTKTATNTKKSSYPLSNRIGNFKLTDYADTLVNYDVNPDSGYVTLTVYLANHDSVAMRDYSSKSLNAKCIGKRVNETLDATTYQLKIAVKGYDEFGMPHITAKWVNTDRETYNRTIVPQTDSYLYLNDLDKFNHPANKYLPEDYKNHLFSTKRVNLLFN